MRWLLLHFWTFHLCYLIFLIFGGAFAFRCVCPDWPWSTAIFMAASSMSQAGLSVVNFVDVPSEGQVISFVLIILGSPLLLTAAPVVLRWYAKEDFTAYRKSMGRRNSLAPLQLESR